MKKKHEEMTETNQERAAEAMNPAMEQREEAGMMPPAMPPRGHIVASMMSHPPPRMDLPRKKRGHKNG